MDNKSETAKSQGSLSNFPDYPNLFIGREFHLQSITKFFRQDHIRLITLLGPGGIGKTRLSVEIGTLLVDDFPDGICFVPLDALNKHEEVPLYLGQALQLTKKSNCTWQEMVLEFLAPRNMLIILDNLEQIIETSAFVDQLLKYCPSLKILATSRENLGIPYEVEYPLDGLSRPHPFLYPNYEDLLRFDAIQFFVEKARLVQPNFCLNEDNAEAIINICQLLDGLPLPLELAAARLKLFSPIVIWHKLQDNSKLLQSKSSKIIPRHQTISNTVKWSYDLLCPAEQEIFQQLSIFRGGFSLEAIAYLQQDLDAIEIVESFLNKSLIVRGADVQLEPRFRMLKLMRDFGWERLQENPKRGQYLEHFGNYILSFLEKVHQTLQQKDHLHWLDLIEAEFENSRTAFSFFQQRAPEKAITLMLRIWRFYLSKGLLREGLALIEPLLELPQSGIQDKAALLEAAGTLAHNLGAYAKSKDYFEECLNLRRANDTPVQTVKAMNNLAWIAWRTGDYEECKQLAQKALDLAESIDDPGGKATALNNLAWAAFYQGYFKKSGLLQRKIIEIHTQNYNQKQLAFAKINLGRTIIYKGKIREAHLCIEDGIQLFDEIKDQQMMAFSRLIKAELLIIDQKLDQAKVLLERECLPEFRSIGDLWGIGYTSMYLGKIALQKNNLEQAVRYIRPSLDIAVRTEDKYGQALCYFFFAKIYKKKGLIQNGLESLLDARRLSTAMGSHWLLNQIFQEYGHFFFDQQEQEKALVYWAAARFHASQSGVFQLEQFDRQYANNFPSCPPLANIIELEEDCFPAKEDLQEHLTWFQDKVSGSNITPKTSPGISGLNSSKLDPFMRKVHQLINENISNPDFRVADLAQCLHLSPSHLHRKLDMLAGQSASTLIRQIRLEKAKQLLADPHNTITAIAFETGFKDPDYFHRVFKKQIGQTPGAYRKMLENRTD